MLGDRFRPCCGDKLYIISLLLSPIPNGGVSRDASFQNSGFNLYTDWLLTDRTINYCILHPCSMCAVV